MLLERSRSRSQDDTLTIGKQAVLVRVVTRIDRRTYPAYFPEYGFDPIGAARSGFHDRLGEVSFETFYSPKAKLSVPKDLTEVIRYSFPACTWDCIEGRLYAVFDGRVVAVINDGSKGSW
jgi:hypothetical protein